MKAARDGELAGRGQPQACRRTRFLIFSERETTIGGLPYALTEDRTPEATCAPRPGIEPAALSGAQTTLPQPRSRPGGLPAFLSLHLLLFCFCPTVLELLAPSGTSFPSSPTRRGKAGPVLRRRSAVSQREEGPRAEGPSGRNPVARTFLSADLTGPASRTRERRQRKGGCFLLQRRSDSAAAGSVRHEKRGGSWQRVTLTGVAAELPSPSFSPRVALPGAAQL